MIAVVMGDYDVFEQAQVKPQAQLLRIQVRVQVDQKHVVNYGSRAGAYVFAAKLRRLFAGLTCAEYGRPAFRSGSPEPLYLHRPPSSYCSILETNSRPISPSSSSSLGISAGSCAVSSPTVSKLIVPS